MLMQMLCKNPRNMQASWPVSCRYLNGARVRAKAGGGDEKKSGSLYSINTKELAVSPV